MTENGVGGNSGLSYRIPLSSLPAEAQIRYLRENVMRDMEGTDYAFDLAGYKARKGEAGLKILLERQEAVIAFHVLKRDGKGCLKQRVDTLAAEHGVSSMTIRRWVKGYAEAGLGSLVRDGRSDKGKSRCMCMEARRFICEQYLSPEQRTQALVLDKLADRIEALGADGCRGCPYNPASANHLALVGTEDEAFFPACDQIGNGIIMKGGKDAVRRVIESISDAEKTYMRKGRKAWEAAYMVKGTRVKPEAVNEAWFGDHHQFDVFVLDEKGNAVRPWLTAWYDIGSGCMAGWCISTNPNSETILEAFARGAARKANNPICGIPRYCYIDNGKDYRGQRFEGGELRDYELKGLNANLNAQGLMQVLHIEVKHAKPYHGWAKPVERWFRTLEERYCRDLPGYCAGRPENRPENFDRSLKQLIEHGGLLTLDELGDIFINEILPAYHNRPHAGYSGEAPMERYLRLPKARSEEIGWNTLAIIKKEAATRVVSTQGIQFNSRLYGRLIRADHRHEDTGLDFVPVYIIINGGLSGDLSGESDVKELAGNQLAYNHAKSDDIDALKYNMFPQRVFTDASQESMDAVKIAPNAVLDLQTEPGATGARATAGVLESTFNYDSRLQHCMDLLRQDMYSLLSIPQVTKDALQGIGVSGKAMRAMYWELICRCDEKWADAWDDAIRWMVEHLIRMARLYGEQLPEIGYTVTIDHLYPLMDDEEEERDRDLNEVSRQARSRKSYIQKWHSDDDPDAELTQIKAERQLLEESWADGLA